MTDQAPQNQTPTNNAPTPEVTPPTNTPPADNAATPPVDNAATPPGKDSNVVDPATGKPPVPTISDQLPDPKEVAAPADWPTDWREKFAGDDEKLKELFKRYNSPNDVAKAFLAQRQKLSEGGNKIELPENPTEEQLAEYRKQVGIPEAADKYDLTLADGMVIGDDDKPLLDAFLKDAHASNMPQKELSKALNAYYKLVADTQAKQYDADVSFKEKMEDTLRAEWGQEYRANQNMLYNFLNQNPDITKKLEYARDSEGNLLMNDPAMLRWVAALARERNTPFTNIPNGTTQMKHMEARKTEIKKMMAEAPNDYYGNPQIQTEYRQILEAEEAMKKTS